MKTSRAQIIVTIGPSSSDSKIIGEMMAHSMDIVRLNFGWGNIEEHKEHLHRIREAEKATGRKIKIIFDLPGPRIQKSKGHTYDKNETVLLTAEDEKFIEFGVQSGIDYFALSFVGNKEDVFECRNLINKYNGSQLLIAKIERQKALDNLEEIMNVSDAIMIARGDLGEEIPLETIPFVQDRIIKLAKKMAKPVITATNLMLSMTENTVPTRAEVTDVANAILEGSDAVMLSNETAAGKYPLEVVVMMERIIIEAEKHMEDKNHTNPL